MPLVLISAFPMVVAANEVDQQLIEAAKQDALQKNNEWVVRIDNKRRLDGHIFATIKKSGDRWEIDSFYTKAPDVTKASGLELFAATPDLRYWTNFHTDMVSGCDNDKSKYLTICSSSFADRKTGRALAAIFFGGEGKIATGYVDDKVAEAIHSIPPEQANAKLSQWKERVLAQQQVDKEKKALENEAKKQAENTARQMRADARIGTREWCEQDVTYFNIPGALGPGIQVRQSYRCFTFGTVDESILRTEGWTITSKQSKNIGTAPQVVMINDIQIEKVR